MAMQRKRRRRSGGNSNNNNNNSPNPNRHYESNGPDVRIRGSAQQILDKYLQYARDAQTAGDRVKAEALFQHAEHYARIVAVFEKQKEDARVEREARDAARAEERAQRDAERGAQGEGEEAISAEDGETSEGPVADTAEPIAEAKPRRRSRKPREDTDSDAMAVIDEGADMASVEPAEASADTAEKPKRRRTYNRKKSDASDAAEESDGVMKTLARGTDEVIAD